MDIFRYYITLVEAVDLDSPPDVKNVERTDKPSMYKVLLHNCDYVEGMFVADLLQKHFGKTIQEAVSIMLAAHRSNLALVGVYTKDIAETKVTAAIDEAKASGYDTFLMTVEKE